MARILFGWLPDTGSTLSQTPQVHVVRFGDGYESRTLAGLNTQPKSWPLTFTRSRLDIVPILQFLQDHKGVDAFDWTDPYGAIGVYVCREWKVAHNSGHAVMTCSFEQVFEA